MRSDCRESGDCVILLIAHPGPNELGRYFPPSRVNELLLAKTPEIYYSPHSERPEYTTQSDDDDTNSRKEDFSYYSVMDLASFLEYVNALLSVLKVLNVAYPRFAIQSTHCLELVHK